MALTTSTLPPFITKFQFNFSKSKPYLHQGCLLSPSHRRITPVFSMNARMADFSGANERLSFVKERLWEVVPQPVKEFPVKKAENILIERFLLLGEKTLKWSVVVLFLLSSLSDTVFSISANKELIIPFGLFLGCLMTDFLKEISQEMFNKPEGKTSSKHLLGIGCFFVLIKLISIRFGLQTQVFLLHLGNGGIMQVIWLWKTLLTPNQSVEENSSPVAA